MGNKRSLNAAVRESVEKCFSEGLIDTHAVVDRLKSQGHNITPNQVGGLLTLWKRRLAGAGTGFQKQPDAVPSSTRSAARDRAREDRRQEDARHRAATAGTEGSSDGFNWSTDGAATSAGVGFGQAQIEIHVKRISPPDGFLGVEPDGFTLAQLGQKYGGNSTYELIKYANGAKVGVVREPIGPTYGPPKNPRLAGFPRLVPAGEDPERPIAHRPNSSAGELNDVVSTMRTLKDMVQEDHKGAAAAEAKIIDKALDAVTKKSEPAGDSMTSYLRELAARDEKRLEAERDRWAAERKEREDRARLEKDAAQEAHKREMDRLRLEFENREKEAKRLADERDRRDKEHRDFLERMEKDRESRLQKSLEETNDAIAGVQASMKEELEKNLAHQKELADLERERLKAERERDMREVEAMRSHQREMYDLQLKLLPGAGGEKSTEMIVKVVQDALTKADQKASQILEAKKLQALIAAVGPENAKQLATAFLMNGGVNLGDMMSGKGPASGAPRPAPAASDGAAPQPAPTNPMGDAMNGIAQQVYGTPFFKDLVGIWAGHLRMKRTPYLFANQMAGYMIQDHRVELFYNYMAGLTWEEFWAEIKEHVPAEKVALFQTPEAGIFFDAVINLVAQRVEKDCVERGFAAKPPSAPEPVPAPTAPAVAEEPK